LTISHDRAACVACFLEADGSATIGRRSAAAGCGRTRRHDTAKRPRPAQRFPTVHDQVANLFQIPYPASATAADCGATRERACNFAWHIRSRRRGLRMTRGKIPASFRLTQSQIDGTVSSCDLPTSVCQPPAVGGPYTSGHDGAPGGAARYGLGPVPTWASGSIRLSNENSSSHFS